MTIKIYKKEVKGYKLKMKIIKPFSGIKAKTTFYTIIPVVITFLIIYSVLFVSLFNSHGDMAKTNLQNITSKYTASFERKINNALDYLSSVTSILEFQVYEGNADREALQRIMYYIFDGHTVDSSSIYFEPNMYDGKDIEYINTVYGSALSGRISYYFYRFNGRTGYRQAAMDNDIEFLLPQYIDTKLLNVPTYTEPGIYNIDGEDTLKFVITYPIFGRNYEFIGVITADIFLGDIHAELQAEQVYETGYILIANDREQIIYSPRFEDIGKTRDEIGLLYPLPPGNVTSEIFSATSIINNKKTLVSRQTIYFPQFDSRFFISVAAPFSEINAAGFRLLIGIVSFSLMILAGIATFLYYLIGKMTKPLIDFTNSADKIAHGNFDAKITGDYQDEFAVLQETMNLMTERIRNTFNILQNILNGIDAFIYVTEPKSGKILFINDQMKKEFDIKGNAIGQYCFKVFQNNDKICDFCPCLKLDENPNVPVVWEECNNITKRFYHNTDCYIDWIGGSKAHLQHSVDITDLKTVTEEKIKAEETSRMKSSFLANMSHEIRTPMNAILGVTELLIQNEKLPAEVEEGLEKIYSSCDLLLGIINDILDFSKIEAGKLDIVPLSYKVASLINDSIHLNMMRMDQKPIDFELTINENIPLALAGDELRIKQILNNLLSNAFKYTDSGKVTLSVDFEIPEDEQFTEDKIILVLSVRDTGHGMTKKQLEEMFEEYSRFNQDVNINVEGTGLGLAITQRLISLMNGNMQVQSEKNKGSLFIVKLPQKKVTSDILGKELADNLRQFRLNYMTQRKNRQIVRDPMPYGKVLVVDDVETNIYVAVGLLKLYKLQIDTAMCGLEAISKVEEGNVYDVIFMDHMMPELDGIETVKILRNKGYKAPIVALTANAVLGQADIFLQNGFNDFISKPIDIRQLNSILNRLVRDKQLPEVIEASRRNADNADTDNENTRTEQLLLESFIRDGLKALSWIDDQILNDNHVLQFNDEAVIRKFTVIVHGMKSSLWNIGETELAESAGKLEKYGKDGNADLLASSAPGFAENLRTLLKKLELKNNEHNNFEILNSKEMKIEDINALKSVLNDKFQSILERAEDYDRKGILDILEGIKKGTKETKAVLDAVTTHVTHSNFEDIINDVKTYLSVLSS